MKLVTFFVSGVESSKEDSLGDSRFYKGIGKANAIWCEN
jgi:hypothetical protein